MAERSRENGPALAADGGGALPQNSGVALGAVMCMLSMACAQFGAALSNPTIAAYGAGGAGWLRFTFAAVILAVIVRPPVLRYNREQWLGAIVLGATTAGMTICFFEAMQRVPLGLTVAIDFLGPLLVATFAYGVSWRLVWPLLAAAGVLLLAHDGDGWVGNTAGVLFACGTATGWGAYILLTKKIGTLFKGLEGLSMSLIVAAFVAAPFGLEDAAPAIGFDTLAEFVGLAVLVPLMPYALEMTALRRMPTSSFGILMSLEPAFGALAGFVILMQPMTALQMLGTALVIAASAGATFAPERRR